MAKITVAGQAVVIASTLKLEDIKLLEKYRPEALVLTDEEKEPVFKIGTTYGVGTIGTYGASFSDESNDDQKLATITLLYEGETDNLKESIVDSIGGALLKLNKLERMLPAVLEEISAEKAEIFEHIQIIQ